MLDGHVESILSLRTSEPVGDNLTAVWNRRTEDGSWSSASWTSQDQSRIISEVKYELSLPETTDASWPIQPAIQSLRATEMAAFEHGLLVSDPFANLVANGTELAAILLEALEDSGWQAANLAPIFEPDEPLCDSMVVLDYAASLVESETELFAPTVVVLSNTYLCKRSPGGDDLPPLAADPSTPPSTAPDALPSDTYNWDLPGSGWKKGGWSNNDHYSCEPHGVSCVCHKARYWGRYEREKCGFLWQSWCIVWHIYIEQKTCTSIGVGCPPPNPDSESCHSDIPVP